MMSKTVVTLLEDDLQRLDLIKSAINSALMIGLNRCFRLNEEACACDRLNSLSGMN